MVHFSFDRMAGGFYKVFLSGIFMRIEQITLREIRMRLKAPFETSFGVTQDRRILLVEVMADGLHGWGEITAMESPSYNSETTETAWHITSDFIAPVVVGGSFASAAEIPEALGGIRGHSMAKAGIEMLTRALAAEQQGPRFRVITVRGSP